jgi:hypothetical protein
LGEEPVIDGVFGLLQRSLLPRRPSASYLYSVAMENRFNLYGRSAA